MIDNNATVSNNLSNNNIASGNLSQNTLVSFNNIFGGLEKIVGLFFPSLRNAYVERYRAETFYKIGLKTKEIIDMLNIASKPIPPKAALPLFEKATLEHEEEMYELWAKLLAGAIDNYTPIQIQYSEILAKIGKFEARLLLDIYKNQKGKPYLCGLCDEAIKIYENECLMADIADKIASNIEIGETEDNGDCYEFHSVGTPEIYFNVPYPKDIDFSKGLLLYQSSSCGKKTIELLSALGLIKDYFFKQNDYVVLTEYGYNFVETLESYNIEDK